MSLTHTTLVFFAALLAGIEASAPRLSQSQKCGIFGFSDRKTCRPGAALGVFDGNWTDLAETELINNRRRLVIPYVIRPNFSDKPDLSWKGRSRGVTKPANAEEWINRIRPAVAKAAEFYEPTNVFFKEYYQTDIDSGRFTDKHYVIISDFYDGVSTGCTSDLGPNLSGEKNYIEVDAENCRRDMGNGNEYHPGVIAHEFMHVLGFLHEHQRKDRDKFLKVTIPRNDVFNYDIKRGGRLLTAYDPESITHYGLNKYIKINSAHPPSTNMNLIGQREKLSALDVQQINIKYPVTQCFHSEILGGNWALVRRKEGNDERVHPANDMIQGTEEYGNFVNDPTAPATFSRKFDYTNFRQYLFATGDGQHWLVADKTAVFDGQYYHYDDPLSKRTILASSWKPSPYKAKWFNRRYVHQDPWISIKDHYTDGRTNTLYGENSMSARHHSFLSRNHNGINVFIRVDETSCLDDCLRQEDYCEKDSKRAGFGYCAMKVDNIDACVTVCQNVSKCKYWTYVEKTSWCYLKDRYGKLTEYDICDAGKKDGTTYRGWDYRGGDMNCNLGWKSGLN